VIITSDQAACLSHGLLVLGTLCIMLDSGVCLLEAWASIPGTKLDFGKGVAEF
jgi:hypothetical protein